MRSASERELLILARGEVESLLEPMAMLEALGQALVAWSSGRCDVPPRTAARAEQGILAVMPGYVDEEGLGVKVVTVFPHNHLRSPPSHQALIVLCNAEDGAPYCVMDGVHITGLRTAGASALSARLLAPPDAQTLAIVGGGVQAKTHLDMMTLVRGFSDIRIWARKPEQAETLAAGNSKARRVDSVREAVREAAIVCLCTHSSEPLFESASVSPGTHVVSVGSGCELDPTVLALGRVFVEWRGAVTNLPPAGAQELQGMDPDGVTELGEVLAAARPGRITPEEITVYKSTGLAVEDIVTARLVYRAAVEAGAGTRVEM